jgi:hypothetical protein
VGERQDGERQDAKYSHVTVSPSFERAAEVPIL